MMSLVLAALLLVATVPVPLAGALAAPLRLEAAAGVLADALDADVRRAEAALLAAATALGGQATSARGAPSAIIPFLSVDHLVRGVASALGLSVVAFDARLAPLVDSAVPFGVPLPASPAAHLAADALDAMRAVGGTVDVPGGGLHAALAVPISGPENRPLGALVALLPPDRLSATLDGATEGMDGLAAARLEAQPNGQAEEAGAAPLVIARHGEEPLDGAAPAVTRPLRHHPGLSVRAFGLPEQPPSQTAPPPPAPVPEVAAGGAPWLPIATGLFGLLGGALLAQRRRPRSDPPRHDAGEQEARQALAELRAICDTIPVGLALLDADRDILSANKRMAAFAGLPEDALPGRPVAAILPPVLAEAIEAAHLQVMRSGRAVLDVPVAVEAPGTLRHTRHLLVSCHPVRDASRRVEAVSASVQDVTERTRAEAGRNLLVRELNHRVKNCLATVQTIAQQTLRNAGGDLGDFARGFGERIRALARAHDLLTVHAWGDAELLSVARAALSPWLDDRRLVIEPGPEVMLRPAQAQALVLAFNELATNAAKYGALTREEGRVRLRWGAEPDGTVCLSWSESGGPPVEAPARRGFGSRLLEQALRHDLGTGAKTELSFEPSGLRAEVRFRAGGMVPQRVAA